MELDSREGKHGGQFQGVQYFDCDEDRGVFAPLYKVALLSEPSITEADEEFPTASKPVLRRECTFTIDDDSAIGDQDFSDLTSEQTMERRGQTSRRPVVAKANNANAKRRPVASGDTTFVLGQSEKAVNRTFAKASVSRTSSKAVNATRTRANGEQEGVALRYARIHSIVLYLLPHVAGAGVKKGEICLSHLCSPPVNDVPLSLFPVRKCSC